MKKLFVRFFLGFVGVLAVVFSIQMTVFLVNTHQQQKLWSEDVYRAYVDSLANLLLSSVPEGGWRGANMRGVVLEAADDRVSGLLLKDGEGALILAFGKRRNGAPFPEKNSGRGRADEFHQVSARTDTYVIALNRTGKGSLFSRYTQVVYEDKRKSVTLSLPGNLTARDIAGSVVVLSDGLCVATIDVLAFTPFAYKPFAHFLAGIIHPVIWSILAGLVLALLIALLISRKNQKYVVGIQNALAHLAKGEYDISLPKTGIEEQMCINDSIRDLGRKLSSNELSRSEWLRSISHDLNTPVTSMKLMLDGIADGVFPLAKETLEKIRIENDDLSHRIRRVALYTKLLSHDAKPTRTRVDGESLVLSSMREFTPEERGRVRIHGQGEARLEGDAAMLSVACRELLENALKADGNEVDWTLGNNEIRISNGGQLPADIDFFEPWTKGDRSRGSQGNGLGLPIVAQIMRLHHGKATICRENGKIVATLFWPVT